MVSEDLEYGAHNYYGLLLLYFKGALVSFLKIQTFSVHSM